MPARTAAKTSGRGRPTESYPLHFNLSHSDSDADYTFHACLKSFPIKRHTAGTLKKYKSSNAVLKLLPDAAITHYIPNVTLPSDSVALLQVTKKTTVKGKETDQLVAMAIHIPNRGWQKFRRGALKRRATTSGSEVHPKLARYGVNATALQSRAARDHLEFPEEIMTFLDPFDTAVALLTQHPNLLNLSTKDDFKVPTFIRERCIAEVLRKMQGLPDTIEILGDKWAKQVPLKENGQEVKVDGQTVFTRELHPNVIRDMQPPLFEALKRSQNYAELKDEQWSVQYGVTSSTYKAQSDKVLRSKSVLRDDTGLGKRSGSPFNWTVQNVTPHRGLEVESTVTYVPPPANNTWKANGLWSHQDKVSPFSDDLVKELLAGSLYVKVSTPANPKGLIRGLLKLDGKIQENNPVNFKAILDGKQMSPPVTTDAKGTAGFTLNVTRSGLTYDLTAEGLGDSASALFCKAEKGQPGADVRQFDIGNMTSYATLRLACKNHWLRHLGAYVEFLNTAGESVALPDWSSRMPGLIQPLFEPSKYKKYLSLVPPISTVAGIPLPAYSTVIDIPIPARDVHIVRMHWGGLGRGKYDIEVCPVGIVCTSVIELALPFILLLAGTAVENSKVVQDIMGDSDVLFAVLAACSFLVAGGSAAYIGTAQDPMRAVKDVAAVLGPMLAKPALKGLALYVARKIGEGAAVRAIPIVNVAMQVLSAAITAAQLTQTIVHVLQSPFVYQTDVTKSIDLEVEIIPDQTAKKFPDHHALYRVSVVYDRGATNPVYQATLPPRTLSDPINVKFNGIPAGGRVKVYVFFYAANGWQSGQGETPWIDAKGSGGTSTLSIKKLEVTNNKIPLSEQSVYAHTQKMVYRNGQHDWMDTIYPPKATRKTSSPFPEKEIIRHVNITLAQSPGMFGYCWQATGLNLPKDNPANPKTKEAMYTMQNLSLLEHPEVAYSSPQVGFGRLPGMLYDIASKDDGTGHNFFIDPTMGEFDADRNVAGGFHLRQLSLKYKGAPPDFSVTNQSWGRFPMSLDRFVLHPEGYVLGISYGRHKIFSLKLPDKAATDDKAPFATMASGEGFRDGLINGPEAIAVALDGRVLILEGGNHRVQAFDIEGNPVRYFADPKKPGGDLIPRMELKNPTGSHYLDLSVESQGYIYVLAFSGDGGAPGDYRVDLYKPNGSFLVTTPNVTAAKMVVDILRSMYTLNYEVFLGKDGRIEPSVSMWLPPPPPRPK